LKSEKRQNILEAFLYAWLCIALFVVGGKAQWISDPQIDQRVQKGIQQIYNFDFPAAESTFTAVIAMRPDHPAGYFFRAMIQWERILSNFDDETQDDKLYELLDVVVDMSEKRLEENGNDITALFFKGGAVGFRGRLRANRGKWVGAANDGLVALPLVRQAFEIDPKNYDILLGMGIYNYYAAVVPDKYPIVKPVMVFFPSGDRVKGLEQLRLASENAKYAKVEATYFLMQNYFMFEKDFPKALVLSRDLHAQFPNNPVFHRYFGRCLISMGYLPDAEKIFREILARVESRQTGYDRYDAREATYYLGRSDFQAGRMDAALRNLYRCDELSRGLDKEGPSGFMSLANLMIGMIYDAQGNRTTAVRQYKKVLGMKEYERSHEESKRYLEAPYRR
jgi:tetratricopeptide (TPR) repeat protein